jgi:NTE family protein
MAKQRLEIDPQRIAPVRRVPTDPPEDAPEEGTALCLSGGGYRAMLFHLGALWRLNEVGRLRNLAQVSSVSGGSIAAAVLGLKWDGLDFDGRDVARRFEAEVVDSIRRLAGRTLDWKAALSGMLIPGSTINARLASAYRRHLFGKATLQDLPDPEKAPLFVLNATNLQSGALWRFSRPSMADWMVGEVQAPEISLSVAVAASSAFPPVLSPAELSLPESAFEPASGQELQGPPYTTRVVLADGGVYDNLGLESAWKGCKTVLISDGGGHIPPQPRPRRDWGLQAVRVLKVVDNQVRDLRKRQAVTGFEAGLRDGAYWGIRSDILNYGLDSALPCDVAATDKLATISTRLASLDDADQEHLINWGYAICDAAIRAHVDPSVAAPSDFPYPNAGVG